MPTHLTKNHLANTQQLEVAICGPDGATHLILCTGIAHLGGHGRETYTFLAGPHLSRRQFVAAIASGALSQLQRKGVQPADQTMIDACLFSIAAEYDDGSGRVIISMDASHGAGPGEAAISYQVSILAELPANSHTK